MNKIEQDDKGNLTIPLKTFIAILAACFGFSATGGAGSTYAVMAAEKEKVIALQEDVKDIEKKNKEQDLIHTDLAKLITDIHLELTELNGYLKGRGDASDD